jgi:hypothetical protein
VGISVSKEHTLSICMVEVGRKAKVTSALKIVAAYSSETLVPTHTGTYPPDYTIS